MDLYFVDEKNIESIKRNISSVKVCFSDRNKLFVQKITVTDFFPFQINGTQDRDETTMQNLIAIRYHLFSRWDFPFKNHSRRQGEQLQRTFIIVANLLAMHRNFSRRWLYHQVVARLSRSLSQNRYDAACNFASRNNARHQKRFRSRSIRRVCRMWSQKRSRFARIFVNLWLPLSRRTIVCNSTY